MSTKKDLQRTHQDGRKEERVERRSFLKAAGAATAFTVTGFAFARSSSPKTWWYYHGGTYPRTKEFTGQECPCTCYCTCSCYCGCICMCWCTCPTGSWSNPNAVAGHNPWAGPYATNQYSPYISPLENPRVAAVAADEATVTGCR